MSIRSGWQSSSFPKQFLLCSLFFIFGESYAEEQTKNAVVSDADSFIITNEYVHNWIRVPVLSGQDLNGQHITQKPKESIADVVIFIASYCVPCQQLTRYLLDLERKYSSLNARFTWVFSQDMSQDAIAFSKQYGIKNAIIADDNTMKNWKNPKLPGVFLGDRNGWLLAIFPSATPRGVLEIDRILSAVATY